MSMIINSKIIDENMDGIQEDSTYIPVNYETIVSTVKLGNKIPKCRDHAGQLYVL